jgi:hypothetical protein
MSESISPLPWDGREPVLQVTAAGADGFPVTGSTTDTIRASGVARAGLPLLTGATSADQDWPA